MNFCSFLLFTETSYRSNQKAQLLLPAVITIFGLFVFCPISLLLSDGQNAVVKLYVYNGNDGVISGRLLIKDVLLSLGVGCTWSSCVQDRRCVQARIVQGSL